jgi:hypothetical protein
LTSNGAFIRSNAGDGIGEVLRIIALGRERGVQVAPRYP